MTPRLFSVTDVNLASIFNVQEFPKGPLEVGYALLIRNPVELAFSPGVGGGGGGGGGSLTPRSQ